MGWVVLTAIAFAVGGGALAWVLARAQGTALRQRLQDVEQQLGTASAEVKAQNAANTDLRQRVTQLESDLKHTRESAEEKLRLLSQAKDELSNAFKALSAEALKSNNESFLQLARESMQKFQTGAQGDLEKREQAVAELVSPIKDTLEKFDAHVRQVEKERGEAYGTLTAQVNSLRQTQESLRDQTGKLVQALRAPSVRGRWGEIQLRRVVEIAGMLPYCDFEEQATVITAEGRLRPDLVVKLPGGKNLVVDAKTPLAAYLDAMEAQDEEVRRAKLADHARQVRDHMVKLGSKSYWEQFEHTPEFVVMFLPGETFFSAALEQDPSLIESGVYEKVIPASPTTLIALLKAVAYGWGQERIARSAQQISALGKELHERLRHLARHFEDAGKGLDKAVECYNKAIGSLEGRVLVSARKLNELTASAAAEIPELEPIETTARTLQIEFEEEESLAEAKAAEAGSNGNLVGSRRT
jgi:DNA recombination protein RmuC